MADYPDVLIQLEYTNLNIHGKLGCGNFGVVYKAHCPKLNEDVAVKEIKDRENFKEDEIKTLVKSIVHKNVIAIKAVIAPQNEEDKYWIVIEYCDYNLKQIRDNIPYSHIPWARWMSFMKDILAGLLYLHEKKCVHCDLKPENILVNDRFVAKIADVGLSRIAGLPYIENDEKDLVVPSGTLVYISPERLENPYRYPQFSDDYYSCGLVFYKMITNGDLFCLNNVNDEKAKITQLKLYVCPKDKMSYRHPLEDPERCFIPHEITEAISILWDKDHGKRDGKKARKKVEEAITKHGYDKTDNLKKADTYLKSLMDGNEPSDPPPAPDQMKKKTQFMRELTETYKDLCGGIQPVRFSPDKYFIADLFVQSRIKFLEVKQGVDKTEENWIELQDYRKIFTDPQFKSKRRIIYGEPGYGKSTLALQITHDWLQEMRSMKDFEILILLRLRQFRTVPTVYSAIKKFLLQSGTTLTEDDIEIILNRSSTLILLDEYDEYPGRGNKATDIEQIVSGDMFQNHDVVVMTRKSCPPLDPSLEPKRIELNGFDAEARRSYKTKTTPDLLATHNAPSTPSHEWMDEMVKDEVLLVLSSELGNKWKFIGRYLNLADRVLDFISTENVGNHHEMAYKMLLSWKLENSEKATYKILEKVIKEEVGFKLVEKLRTLQDKTKTTPDLLATQNAPSTPSHEWMDEMVKDEVMMKLMSELVYKWKFIGRFLSLTEAELDHISDDNFCDQREMAYHMLRLWKRKNAESATYKILAKALTNVKRIDLVEKLKTLQGAS